MQVKPAFVLSIVLAVVALGIWLATRAMSSSIGTDTMTFERKNFSVVIIRDESVASSAAYGKIIYSADESAHVQAGDVLAQVYKWGYNENVLQDLWNLQQEIYQYQVDTILQDIVNVDLVDLQDRIENKLQEIHDCMKDPQQGEMLQLSRDLSELLMERRTFLRASTQPDVKLNALYASEQDYLLDIDDWIDLVLAGGDGLVSFAFDDYERVLNAQTLSTLTPQIIQAALDQKPISTVSATDDERSLYRLINPDVFYIAICTSTRDNYHMVEGSSYEVDFGSLYEKTYDATVVVANHEAERSVYILQIDDDVSPFLSLRRANIDIKGTFSGLSAPKNVLTTVEGQEGIYIQTGNAARFVAVEVLCEEGNKILFRSDDPNVVQGVRTVRR